MPKEDFPPGVIVRNHEKGWMDETLTLDWINSVLGKRLEANKEFTCVGRFPVPQNSQNEADPEAEGYNASHHSGRNDQHFTANGRQH